MKTTQNPLNLFQSWKHRLKWTNVLCHLSLVSPNDNLEANDLHVLRIFNVKIALQCVLACRSKMATVRVRRISNRWISRTVFKSDSDSLRVSHRVCIWFKYWWDQFDYWSLNSSINMAANEQNNSNVSFVGFSLLLWFVITVSLVIVIEL